MSNDRYPCGGIYFGTRLTAYIQSQSNSAMDTPLNFLREYIAEPVSSTLHLLLLSGISINEDPVSSRTCLPLDNGGLGGGGLGKTMGLGMGRAMFPTAK